MKPIKHTRGHILDLCPGCRHPIHLGAPGAAIVALGNDVRKPQELHYLKQNPCTCCVASVVASERPTPSPAVSRRALLCPPSLTSDFPSRTGRVYKCTYRAILLTCHSSALSAHQCLRRDQWLVAGSAEHSAYMVQNTQGAIQLRNSWTGLRQKSHFLSTWIDCILEKRYDVIGAR